MTPGEREKWERDRSVAAQAFQAAAPVSSPETARPAQSPGERDVRLLSAWNALKPGDTFQPAGGAVQIVKRKSKYSLTTTNGLRWSAGEVFGVRDDRMRGLIDGR